MKRRHILATALSLPFFLWMGSLALTTEADSTEEEIQQMEDDADEIMEEIEKDLQCSQAVTDAGNALVEEYAEFLNNYFLSAEEATSEQIIKATEYERFVQEGINNAYNANATFGNFEYGDDFEIARQSISLCQQTRDQYLDFTGQMLHSFALPSATGKQSVLLLDAMGQMNDNLNELYLHFNEVFPGNFNQLNNAIPCFAKSCVGS